MSPKIAFFVKSRQKERFYNDNYRYIIIPFDANASYKYSKVCNLRLYCRRLYDMLPSLAQATQLKAEYIHKNLLASSFN